MFYKIVGIKRQVLISLCMYLGQMMVGFSVAWTGPIFPKLRDPSQSPLLNVPSEIETSLIASFIYLGAVPGPYVMGWLSNIKGRKPCFIIGGVIISLAYLVLMFSKNLALMYCGRIMTGAGVSIISVMNLVYIGEIASTNVRGILLTAVGISTTCGAILLFAIGPFFSYFVVTSVGFGVSLVFTLIAVFIPESPIFYVLKDREDKVREKLEELGRDKDVDKILALKEEFINTTATKDWKELLTLKSNRRALFVVATANILQHCSGIFAIVAFSTSIFEMAGSSVSPDIAMIIIGFFQLSGSTTAPFLIERIGRKPLLMLSCAMCSLTMFALGLYFYLDFINYSGISEVKWLPFLILILFFIGYDSGLGIIPNVLIGEMFTTNVRSKGSAVAMTSSWISGFLITTAYGAVVEYIGTHVAFWIFACINLITILFTRFFVPETKAKSLLDIQDIMSKDV